MKKKLFIPICLMLITAMTACSRGANSSQTPGQSAPRSAEPANNGGDTITVKDMKGTVEIPANPRRIADVSGSADELIILGVPFIAAAIQWIRTKTGYVCALLFMAFALLLSILLAASIGVDGGSLETLIRTLFLPGAPSEMGRIMLEMRMPRVLAACFTGAAFALAGAVMQGLTGNPLADAGLLGINAGAGFLVALTAVLMPSLPASCVSVSGGIGFIGLVAPHIARRFVGARHRLLLPASMLTGGLFLLLADTMGRSLFQPIEIPVGISISVLAAPYFLYLLRGQI